MAEYKPTPAMVSVAAVTEVGTTTSVANTGIAGVAVDGDGTMFHALLVIHPEDDGAAAAATTDPIAPAATEGVDTLVPTASAVTANGRPEPATLG